jgi:hypothetical protein
MLSYFPVITRLRTIGHDDNAIQPQEARQAGNATYNAATPVNRSSTASSRLTQKAHTERNSAALAGNGHP